MIDISDKNEFTVKWIDSINKINHSEWNSIFPDEILKSIKIFFSMEESFNDIIKYHYLCVYEKSDIVALIPCFEYKLNLDVIASKNLQKWISKTRRYFKNFFSVKVFVLGSYIATCEQYIGIRDGYSIQKLSFIKDIIKKKSTSLKCKITMIKEVPDSQLKGIQTIFDDFIFVDSLPNSYIPLKGVMPYPSGLTTKAKQRYNRAKRDFLKNNLKFEIYDDFKQYSKIAYSLYRNVLNKSHTQFEQLNEKFFANVSENFQGTSYLLVTRDSENTIRAIELIFKCYNKLIPIYIGIDYSYHDVKCLYFNTIAYSAEFAEKNGCDYVVLGQNNYFPKALSGAIIQRGYLGFHSSHKFYSLLINRIFKILFPSFKNEAGVFYNKNAFDKLHCFCCEYNINMLPDQRKSKVS